MPVGAESVAEALPVIKPGKDPALKETDDVVDRRGLYNPVWEVLQ